MREGPVCCNGAQTIYTVNSITSVQCKAFADSKRKVYDISIVSVFDTFDYLKISVGSKNRKAILLVLISSMAYLERSPIGQV